MTIGDDIGITGTLARIREIQAPVTGVTAPASPSAATTTAASGFAQTLAQVQTGQATVPGTASPLGAPALTPNASTAGGLAYASGPPSTGTVTVGGVPMALVPLSAVNGATAATPATGTPAVVPDGAAGTAGPRGRMIAQIATAELGVREQPPGSNDGARIAEYRTATRGSGVGPWCAYFTSWVAAQAGVPIGEGGRGEGWVPSVERWGKDTGRWIPSGAETPAQAGDLIIFDRNGDGLTDHIGVVTGVRADGGLETVEGNSSDAVSRRSYRPGEWAGLVRLVPPGT